MIEAWLDKRHILAMVFDLKTLTPTGGELFDGAFEMLKTFKETKIKMGLVSFENRGWVNLTLDRLAVGEHFDYVGIVNGADSYYGKIGSQDWRNAFDALRFWPQNGIVVGNGLPEDIYKIGVKYRVCVSRNGEMHSSSERPEGIVNIESVAHVARALLAAV